MDKHVVVVTGGGQGIGLAVCHRVTAAGGVAVVVDINGDSAKQAAEQVGGGALAVQCDVTDFDQVQGLAEQVASELGPCAGLVSNVGWTPERTFLETSLEDQDKIIHVNFTGSLHLTRVFLPQMIAAQHGRIVYVSSDAARAGVFGEAIYAGAKAALIGFGKSLALEVGRDQVTVNVVCPGSTETPLLRQIFTEEQIQKRRKFHPMRRLAQPENIASAINYLVSDEAEFINGQVLSVNGGMFRAG